MKITVLNKVNYYLEAIGIITLYINKEPLYDNMIESLKNKYNIPTKELNLLFDDVPKMYEKIISNIDLPDDRLEFYFLYNQDMPTLGELLMSYIIYNDDEKAADKFLKFSSNEKLKSYINIIYEDFDYLKEEFDFSEFNSKDYINYINNSKLDDKVKLKYILLYYNFDEYFSEVYELVNKVVIILKEMSDILQTIADEFKENILMEIEKYGDKFFENYVIKLSAEKDIIIRPLIIKSNLMVLKPCLTDECISEMETMNVYIGVYVKSLFNLINTYFLSEDRIISTFKALGDKSKFDILKSLKDNKMYGVEIAKKLGLTTATVSHHMSTLYNLSLINYVTDNNKMNYLLNKEKIHEIIAALENIFL